MYILQMISVDFLLFCYMGFCIFHVRKPLLWFFWHRICNYNFTYKYLGTDFPTCNMKSLYFTYRNPCTDIHTWHMKIFTFHMWKSLSIYFRKYMELSIFPKIRDFLDEIWIFVHFSYEKQGIDFLTWHMNRVYFRDENLSSDSFSWNTEFSMFQTWKSYIRYASMKYRISIFPIWHVDSDLAP